MASEITDHDPQVSPVHDDANGNGLGVADGSRGIKRQRQLADDDDDDDEKGSRERRKIEIKFIADKSRRHITFSKRKAGIMKKAYELSVLTGTQVLLLVVSETGLVYTFTTPKLQPLVTKSEGKNLIQACLNAPEPPAAPENGIEDEQPRGMMSSRGAVDSPDEAHAQVGGRGIPTPSINPYPMTTEQAMQYQYLRQPQQQQAGAYPGMAQAPHMAPQQ